MNLFFGFFFYCRYAVDSRTDGSRYVIEPPEVGSALAGMSLSAGTSASRVSAVPAERVDGVEVHASDVELDGCASEASSSSSSSESDTGNVVRSSVNRVAAGSTASPIADVKVGDGGVSAHTSAVMYTMPGDESGRWHHRTYEEDVDADRRVGFRGDHGVDVDDKHTATDFRGEGVAWKANTQRSRRRRGGKKRGRESTQQAGRQREEGARRPVHAGNEVPAYQPPPAFPGGSYVAAAAAGHAGAQARDAYQVAGDDRCRPSRGYSRGRSESRWRGGDRSPARGRSEGPRGRRDDERGWRDRRSRARSPGRYRSRSRSRR